MFDDGGMSAAEARRLRVEEGLSIAQIQARLGVTKHTLTEWLRGIPAPEWTRRPNAKDELRAQALRLRGQGWSVNDIALELGVATSTAWQWVRHLPLDKDSDRARRKAEHAKVMTDAQWQERRAQRDASRGSTVTGAQAWVGRLDDRELLLIGAMAYWCEGAKAKPWRPHDCRVTFTNSDPQLLAAFLAFVELIGRSRAELSYRVAIHESADVAAAEAWWAAQLCLPSERFLRATIKRHAPTNRNNIGSDYRGCLIVKVPRGRELYWQIEGIVAGIAAGVSGLLPDRGVGLR
jgi:transposase